MPAKLSYEPSVEAVIQDVLPDAQVIAADPTAMRRRVSWPLVARATGLGRLEGGEIVLAAAPRHVDIAARWRDLLREGVAMAVVVGDMRSEELRLVQNSRLPIAVVSGERDVGELRGEIERFISRRRRDLFSLDGELHRALIEASIGGATIGDLLAAAATHSGTSAFLERDGELTVAPAGEMVPAELIGRAREVAGRTGTSPAIVGDAGQCLCSPVTSGHEVRGIVGLVDVDTHALDALEAIVVNLASACAITLSREPRAVLPSLADLLSDPPPRLLSGSPWMAGALWYPSWSPERLKRVLDTELDARGVAHALISERDTPIVLAAVDDRFPWEHVLSAIALRLSSPDLRLGLSRHQTGDRNAAEGVRQAYEALSRGVPQKVTRYETVELDALLGSLQGVDAFVRGRLAPLLDGSTSSVELLLTLSTYLETGRNAKEAAVRLSVHRNTLSYRLRRLQDALGIDWDDSSGVFALDLALRLWRRPSTAAGGTDWRNK